jgi:hypothetical protein
MRKITAFLVAFALPSLAAAAPAKPQPVAKPQAPAKAPQADAKAVADLMGPYKWGMTVDEVVGVVQKEVAARVQPQIEKTSDPFQQNKLRNSIKEEAAAFKKTLYKFEGQRSPWDVSIIASEYTHRTGESMLIHAEKDAASGKDQQKFFFFADGKLWKMFIVFNMSAYKDKTFEDFKKGMEIRYGKFASDMRVSEDGERIAYVYWRSGTTFLRALDMMQFYGNFCLALSDDRVEQQLAVKRAALYPPRKTPRGSVTDGGDDEPSHDSNVNVIDSITKKKP